MFARLYRAMDFSSVLPAGFVRIYVGVDRTCRSMNISCANLAGAFTVKRHRTTTPADDGHTLLQPRLPFSLSNESTEALRPFILSLLSFRLRLVVFKAAVAAVEVHCRRLRRLNMEGIPQVGVFWAPTFRF